ncbi:MAG: hypothetical protein WC889_11320 [Myxococcota bacterium]|jgi:hypothetical protein
MMDRKKHIAVLACMFLLPQMALAAGDFALRAEIDRTEVLLGDEIRLKVVITAPEGENFTLPASPDAGKLRLLDRKESSIKGKDGLVARTTEFVLAGYELGDFTVAPMAVLSSTGDTGFKTEEFKLKIVGQIAQGEKPEMKDVAPPVKFMERTWIALYILGGVIALVAAIILLAKWLRKRREAAENARRAAALAEKSRPAHEVALEMLERLLAEDLIAKG